MAIIEVHVPQLSESVAEATLLSWHKKVGEAVARDENLIDIETDKVVLELPASTQGVVVEIVKPDGSTVVSGEIIARIDTKPPQVQVHLRARLRQRRPHQVPRPLPKHLRHPARLQCLPPPRCCQRTRCLPLQLPVRAKMGA